MGPVNTMQQSVEDGVPKGAIFRDFSSWQVHAVGF
jgi:hypothetical protein